MPNAQKGSRYAISYLMSPLKKLSLDGSILTWLRIFQAAVSIMYYEMHEKGKIHLIGL